MSKSHEQLEALIERLEGGGDPARLDIVRRAQRFKRSWLDLAEGLSLLRKSRAYEAWGYADLHDYCLKELHIKDSTIDKLTLSYGALRQHAPDVLKRDGVAREVPPLDAVDYFARVCGANEDGGAPARRRLDAPKEVLEELRSAVFDEGHSVSELRKRFDPVLRPKDPVVEQSEVLRKVKATAEKLAQGVQCVEGLTDKRVARVIASVEALVRDLDELIEQSDEAHRPASKGKSAA
jgi:hypothetical protein